MKPEYQFALIMSLLAASCGQPPSEEAVGAAEADIMINGSIAYRDRVALSPGATVVATLYDVSRAEAAGEGLPEETIVTDGAQVPIPFERILVRKARDRVAQTAVEGLTDTDWIVEDVGGRGIVDRSRATVLLGAEGRISGRATCNNYTGNYDLEGEDFHTRDIVATNRACVEALARQEAEFLRILRSASGLSATEDGALVISNPSGESLIVRRNQPALLTSDILFCIESMRAWRPS